MLNDDIGRASSGPARLLHTLRSLGGVFERLIGDLARVNHSTVYI